MQYSKTLIILSPAFPENEKATYWVPSQQLMVKALKKNYPELQIIVLSLLYPYQSSSYKWHNIDVISFDGTHRRKIRRPGLWRDAWKTLNRVYNEQNVIGIFSFWCGECAFIANRFAKKRKVTHYTWICGQDARKTNKWVRFIRPKANQLIAMSDFLSDEFYKNHGIRPLHIIYNAIDPDSFVQSPQIERDIDILGVGSFEPLKQYDVFAHVVKSIRDLLPGVKAFHCGIGKEKKKIEALIEKLELQDSLHLLGGKTQQEVLTLMQRTKVFLHTSNYEGFSTVCLEALYAGAHVISFCYPLKYKVPHWHVVNSAEEMVSKVIEILINTDTNYSGISLFTMDDSSKAIMNLFEQGINDKVIPVIIKTEIHTYPQQAD